MLNKFQVYSIFVQVKPHGKALGDERSRNRYADTEFRCSNSAKPPNCLWKRYVAMPTNNRVVLSSDHAAIQLRQAIGIHIAASG